MIRDATADDISDIAALAEQRREEYEMAQPQFWRRAADAVERHLPWLTAQVSDPEVISLVARTGPTLDGFVFASVVTTPPVYNPGGPTGLVDDFAVAYVALWATTGRELLDAVKRHLTERGVAQVVVICGHHDLPKRAVLIEAGLSVASEWFVAPLDN